MIGLLLALASTVCAGVGAYYWFKSALVPVEATWAKTWEGKPLPPERVLEPLDQTQSLAGWTVGTLQALEQSAHLNKLGAIWTGVAVLFGGVSALANVLHY